MVSRVVVAVGVPNSKIRTQTVVEVFGTASKTILGTINDSLFEAAVPARTLEGYSDVRDAIAAAINNFMIIGMRLSLSAFRQLRVPF